MKIVYLIHQFYPEYGAGTEAFGLNLAKTIQMAGHDVTVITPDGRPGDQHHDVETDHLFIKKMKFEDIKVVKFKIKNDNGLNFEEYKLDGLGGELFFSKRIDLVHVLHPMRVAGLIPYLIENGIPYIMTLTDFWTICPKINLNIDSENLCDGPKQGKNCKVMCPEIYNNCIYFRNIFLKYTLYCSKCITVPSQFSYQIFSNEIKRSQIKVIEHGIDFKKIKKNGKKYTRGDPLRIFFGGTLTPHKGVHVVLDSFRRLKDMDLKLKLYGPVPDENYFDRLKGQFDRDGRIEYLGEYAPADIGNILANFDLVVLPSIVYETFSFVLHEALACGVPVVASNIGVMPEKLKNGINGFTFEKGNSQELAAVLKYIYNNIEILNKIKRNIIKMNIYHVEQEAAKYETIYRKAILDQQNT